MAAGGFHHDFAGHDQNLLAGNGEVAAGFDGGEGRPQPGGADNGDEHHVRFHRLDQLHKAGFARKNPDIIRQAAGQRRERGGIGQGHVFDPELHGLRGEGVCAARGSEADHFHPLRDIAGDFQGAGADAAGGPEEDDALPLFRGPDY